MKKKYILAIVFLTALIAAFLICTTKQENANEQTFELEYLWSTGDTTATINVTEPGEYWVEVIEKDMESHEVIVTKVTYFQVSDSVAELYGYY